MSATGRESKNGVGVLLVMEDRGMRRHVVENLKSEGYWVDAADEALGAVRQVGRDPPGMVLIDMRSQGVVEHNFIRDISLGHDIPVILIARGESRDVALAFEIGGDDCITDPLGDETVARVRETLRRR